MRLIRLIALFGSVVLLVTVSVSLFDLRGERHSDIDRSISAASSTAVLAVDASIERAMAVAATASAASDPTDLVRSFVDPAEACLLTATEQRCSGRDLGAGTAFGDAAELAARSADRVVAIGDPASDTVLVVAEPSPDATIAIELGAGALIDEPAIASLAEFDAGVELRVVTSEPVSPASPRTVEGRRVVVAGVPLDGGGAVEVESSADDDVGLVGDGLMVYGMLFVLGTVLVGLAGWTFLVDRRSLEHRATTDELTGLVNRREFERRSEQELLAAGRLGAGACLMLIDLNGFKQINDSLGHQFGDLVLTACAERLRAAVRDTDFVGRWGGDEFVILLPGLQDASAVRTSADRIAGRLSASPVVGDVTVTASIGAALYPRHGATLDDLIRGADVAMYEAKSTGVAHRLADPVNLGTMSSTDVVSRRYAGPDRRRSTGSAERSDEPVGDARR